MRVNADLPTAIVAVASAGNRRTLPYHTRNRVGDALPLPARLAGLRAEDAEVRRRTLDSLGAMARAGRLPRAAGRQMWALAADPSPAVRKALVVALQAAPCPLQPRDMEEFLPLLWHERRGVRETILQLFLLVPWYFDTALCLNLAEDAAQADVDVRETVAEFLACLGQEGLLAVEMGENGC